MPKLERVAGSLPQQLNAGRPLAAANKVARVALCAILSLAAFLLLAPEIAIAATAVIIVLTAVSFKISKKTNRTADKSNNAGFWLWGRPKAAEERPQPWFRTIFKTKQPEIKPQSGFWPFFRPIKKQPAAPAGWFDRYFGRIPVGTQEISPAVQKPPVWRGKETMPKYVRSNPAPEAPAAASPAGIRTGQRRAGNWDDEYSLAERQAIRARARIGAGFRG